MLFSVLCYSFVYLGPPLGLLWLALSVGADVGRWDLFLLGMTSGVVVNLPPVGPGAQEAAWLREVPLASGRVV